MYESEVNRSVEYIGTLPEAVQRSFAEYRNRIAARTTLPWGEHCTECVWPTCYTTCDLYSPREDGACRQFVNGATRIDHSNGLSPYVLKIRFKQWAKLWTVGNLHLQPLLLATARERINIAVGAIGRNIPLPDSIKPRVLRKLSYLRRRSAETAHLDPPTTDYPDYFLIECYNPNERLVTLTFTVRLSANPEAPPFQKLIPTPTGFTHAQIPYAEISMAVDTRQAFTVEIIPNDCENAVLYFGMLDFVKERSGLDLQTRKTGQTKNWKCIVWDLDGTLWNGILIEDGFQNIRVRQDVVDLIKRMDQRGILHSIASKNSYDEAMQVLRTFGLDEYFLYPQITWQPKSTSITEIAKHLNIGLDSLVFVDDQEFERQEVKTALPDVAVIDAGDVLSIADRPECLAPVTTESQNRRLLYRTQQQREAIQESYSGDYSAFLKACNLAVEVRSLDTTALKRVHELTERTNQLNFSGSRYSESRLLEIMGSKDLESYVIDCTDRFGIYGIVGFALVDTVTPRLIDLMFSCRVQNKRVEHAVLAFLLKRFVSGTGRDFYASYRRTAKNAPGGKVFEEMGFECVGEDNGVSDLVFRKDREIVDEQIVSLTMRGTH